MEQVRARHIVISEVELNKIPLSTYDCDICGLTVKTLANLRAHQIKTHKILKSESDVAFYRKQKKRVDYVYHCPCIPCKHNIGLGGGFSSSSRLKQNVHMLKCYKCTKCGHDFSTPSSHAYHERLCGIIHTCPTCLRTYSYRKHLNQHFRRTGHQPVIGARSRKVKISEKSSPLCSSASVQVKSQPVGVSAKVVCPTTPSVAVSQSPTLFWLPVLVLPAPLSTCSTYSSCPHPEGDGMCSDHQVEILEGVNKAEESSPAQLSSPVTDSDVKIQTIPSSPTEGWIPLQTQPIENCDFTSQACGTSPLVETYTQTEGRSFASIVAGTEVLTRAVSVNTCTDEDDISTLIGSLLCDASVETSFLIPQSVNEFTDTGLDTMPSSTNSPIPPDVSFDGTGGRSPPGFIEPSFSPNYDAVGSSELGLKDEEIQAKAELENAAMQTEAIAKMHAAASTFDVFGNRLGSSDRPLETPPPPTMKPSPVVIRMPGANDSFYGAPREDQQTQNDRLEDCPLGFYSAPDDLSAERTVARIDRTEFADQPLTSFHSIGLQSSLWSPDPPCCSTMETQTLEEDIESWLSSVHTQTSTSISELSSFINACGGADDQLTSTQDPIQLSDFDNICSNPSADGGTTSGYSGAIRLF
ncbi:unnamed protein product [Calicophoron daubneyi]|uniref:C2H2-type domain-containing protein n=1 Tax=Calicophoron daubneyi TaxID=300641 RepID=A0AAV2TI31_CALDB